MKSLIFVGAMFASAATASMLTVSLVQESEAEEFKEKTYIVLAGSTVHELAYHVEENMAEGWIAIGGVAVNCEAAENNDGERICFFQAMEK